ncbi:MAG: hypothetical protein KAX44_08965, partial [Candidatus Brocadiae bacterium]|nr:hypothetical protein [Candidatus Brocadiia bacterium]
VLWWLLGGSYLLQRAFRKFPEHRSSGFGQYVLASLFSGVAAAITGALVFLLITRIGDATDANLKRAALLPAVLSTFPMAFLVFYAVFQLPFGKLIKTCALPMGSVLLFGGIVAIVCFIPARKEFLRKLRINRSVFHLQVVDDAIRTYERRLSGEPPPTLDSLLENMPATSQSLFKEDCLQCPSLPGVRIGYFYLPSASVSRGDKTGKLRACEFSSPDSDRGRVVLLVNSDAYWVENADFERRLALPENAEFAKAFRAADANR